MAAGDEYELSDSSLSSSDDGCDVDLVGVPRRPATATGDAGARGPFPLRPSTAAEIREKARVQHSAEYGKTVREMKIARNNFERWKRTRMLQMEKAAAKGIAGARPSSEAIREERKRETAALKDRWQERKKHLDTVARTKDEFHKQRLARVREEKQELSVKAEQQRLRRQREIDRVKERRRDGPGRRVPLPGPSPMARPRVTARPPAVFLADAGIYNAAGDGTAAEAGGGRAARPRPPVIGPRRTDGSRPRPQSAPLGGADDGGPVARWENFGHGVAAADLESDLSIVAAAGEARDGALPVLDPGRLLDGVPNAPLEDPERIKNAMPVRSILKRPSSAAPVLDGTARPTAPVKHTVRIVETVDASAVRPQTSQGRMGEHALQSRLYGESDDGSDSEAAADGGADADEAAAAAARQAEEQRQALERMSERDAREELIRMLEGKLGELDERVEEARTHASYLKTVYDGGYDALHEQLQRRIEKLRGTPSLAAQEAMAGKQEEIRVLRDSRPTEETQQMALVIRAELEQLQTTLAGVDETVEMKRAEIELLDDADMVDNREQEIREVQAALPANARERVKSLEARLAELARAHAQGIDVLVDALRAQVVRVKEQAPADCDELVGALEERIGAMSALRDGTEEGDALRVHEESVEEMIGERERDIEALRGVRAPEALARADELEAILAKFHGVDERSVRVTLRRAEGDVRALERERRRAAEMLATEREIAALSVRREEIAELLRQRPEDLSDMIVAHEHKVAMLKRSYDRLLRLRPQTIVREINSRPGETAELLGMSVDELAKWMATSTRQAVYARVQKRLGELGAELDDVEAKLGDLYGLRAEPAPAAGESGVDNWMSAVPTEDSYPTPPPDAVGPARHYAESESSAPSGRESVEPRYAPTPPPVRPISAQSTLLADLEAAAAAEEIAAYNETLQDSRFMSKQLSTRRGAGGGFVVDASEALANKRRQRKVQQARERRAGRPEIDLPSTAPRYRWVPPRVPAYARKAAQVQKEKARNRKVQQSLGAASRPPGRMGRPAGQSIDSPWQMTTPAAKSPRRTSTGTRFTSRGGLPQTPPSVALMRQQQRYERYL